MTGSAGPRQLSMATSRLRTITSRLHLAPLLLALAGCAPAPEAPSSPPQATTQGIRPAGQATPIAASSPAPVPRESDPALSMQGRVAYYPSPWPELAHLDQGSTNYKKLAGTLARIQKVAAKERSAQSQLPTVLINAKNDCIDTPSVGLYKHSCQTIKIDYSDEELVYEYPIEIEAVLAHEWGHHLAATSNLQVSQTEHEIVADCFAGVVFGYYVKHDLITPDEAIKALEMMVDVSNNSEGGIHPNMQNRISAFMGGMAQIADPDGEYGNLYPQYCASLERVLDSARVRQLGLTWQG